MADRGTKIVATAESGNPSRGTRPEIVSESKNLIKINDSHTQAACFVQYHTWPNVAAKKFQTRSIFSDMCHLN